MQVAELFVKLGFKIDGAPAFDKAVGQLGFGEIKAINLKHAILGLGAAFTALMYFAADAATGLYKFHLETGLSTEKLQAWQYAAAKANVSAGDVTNGIKAIQQAQVAIALGEGNVAPWALLGIDPRQDPFKVLWQIHQRVKETGGMAPQIGQYLMRKLGISEDLGQALQRDSFSVGELQDKFKQTAKAQKDMDALSGAFEQMKYKVEQLGIKLAVQFGPQLRKVFEDVVPWIERAANWLQKLSSNTKDGEQMRATFQGWVKTLKDVAVAIIGIGAALKTVNTIIAASTALKFLFGAIGGTVTGIAGAAAYGGKVLGDFVKGHPDVTLDKYYQNNPLALDPTAPYASAFSRSGGANVTGNNTTVNVTVNGIGKDAAAIGKEIAAQVKQIATEQYSSLIDQAQIGVFAY